MPESSQEPTGETTTASVPCFDASETYVKLFLARQVCQLIFPVLILHQKFSCTM